MSSAQEDRVRLVRYSRIAAIVGHSSVYFTNVVSDNMTQFPAFLGACVAIALLSVGFMSYTGVKATSQYDKVRSCVHSDDSGTKHVSESSIWQQTAAILRQRNFLVFVLMNFCQVYHSTFLSNFTRLVCEELIPAGYLTSQERSIFYGLLHITPAIIIVFGSSLLTVFGYFRIVQLSFFIKILTGLLFMCVGRRPWAVMSFFFIESINTNGAYALFELFISDVIDEDRKQNKRTHPRSSMFFGTNALITKPAISLAPMITVAVLGQYGYQDVAHKKPTNLDPNPDLADAMFYLAVFTPIIIGIVQLFVWAKYTIRGSHLAIVQYTDCSEP